jgi:hypothetical protein
MDGRAARRAEVNAARVTIQIPTTPPSLNTWLSQHWRVRDGDKKALEAELAYELRRWTMPDCDRVEAEVSIRFPDRRRRDTGNYTATLEKCLGDVLTSRGYLVDDDHLRFRVRSGQIETEPGDPRTTIILDCYVDDGDAAA